MIYLENIIDHINEYLNKEITLKKEDGKTFKFKVVRIHEDNVTIVPLLPELGEGGFIFTSLENKDKKTYLVNQLSGGY